MKMTTASLLACLIATSTALAAPAAEDNRGVLNGPLTKGGHKAAGEGDRESLRLAIEDLIATNGSAYPKGKEFLARLTAITSEKSPEFLALKKEALLANPLLDFDHLLMVRSSGGSRSTSNWQTQSSAAPAASKLGPRDADAVLKSLCNTDPELGALNKAIAEQRRACDQRKNELTASPSFQAETDRGKKNAMLRNDSALQLAEAGRNAAETALKEAAMKHPAYLAICEQIKNGGTKPNFNDEIVVMSPLCDGEITTVHRPEPGRFIGDVDLHFDGDKLLFSSHVDVGDLTQVPGTNEAKGYGVFELRIDPATGQPRGQPRRVSPDMGWDVDNFDPCYLPDGRIIFASTAAYEGVPCVGGGDYVANLFIMNADGSGVRRLTFDQDGNWHPSVMEDGRVMYTRWEYTDSAHYYSRVLMTMNPDGTDQKALYGSNSYWPNSTFFARQVPGHASMFVATITGHHSHAKGGALCLFDVSKGTQEADGAVQLITGRGKRVEPLVLDNLAAAYAPMFFHPYPLSDKYFLAMTNRAIYLVDVFDNMLLLKAADQAGGYCEPLPLRKTPAPRTIPNRINLASKDATVLINDVYAGPGLAGVPRGTVKSLRVSRYEYGPRNIGGHYAMGMEAGWDAKQMLGWAPVDDDGSASFTVPANTPFSVQPLDKDGRALQLMRSWTVAMPGERLSCVGCHENRNTPPSLNPASAMLRQPSALKPFYGPTRGFSFIREVQPVIDRYCVGCHDGTKDLAADGRDKLGRYTIADRVIGTGNQTGRKFAECGIPDFSNPRRAHTLLHPYVRRNGPEGDYHLLTPLEFHAGTSELFQMLEKGHHNVKLDQEAWDRLTAWADLNAPFHGSWSDAGANKHILARRMELRERYANITYNPEQVTPVAAAAGERVMPAPLDRRLVPAQPPEVGGRSTAPLKFDLGDGIAMELAPIPAGSFSMGSNSETPVEQPVTRVRIVKPFHMGATEVTLEQYRQFDPEYLNGVYDMHYKDQIHRGYYMNDMSYPVIRVSWHQAMAFCEWLSNKTGRKVSLPTEAQWEWACRAGTGSPLSFGDLDTEFSGFANLADLTVKQMAVSGVNPQPIRDPNPDVDFELKDPRSNDGVLHLSKVASYRPNAWGLFDMHGNAAEWTRSAYQPYPYHDSDGRNSGGEGTKTVRGGSWHDRPFRSTSSFRLGFPAWQRVYHTGFRIIVED
jgi:formylglycine-generating enzyme required for sulfatase activity